MTIERDTRTVGETLGLPWYAPLYAGYIDRDPTRFRDCVCDECDAPAAVFVDFTVHEIGEGLIATDATFCADHAGAGVRVTLDREDRSIDHDTDITVNYWAIVYGAFNTDVKELAA